MSPRLEVRWAETAVRDLQSARAYLHERNPQAAARLMGRVLAAVRDLRVHPLIGAVARDLDPSGRCRHRVVERFRIVYRVDDSAIWVVAFWHSRRDPADLDLGS